MTEKTIEDIRSAILEMVDEKHEDLNKRPSAYQAAYLAGVLDSLAVLRQFRINAAYADALHAVCVEPDFLEQIKEKEC